VQGKWKVYQLCGGVVGCVYPKNMFIEITSDKIITDNDAGDHIVRSYSWKKKIIREDRGTFVTYVMWPDGADETSPAGTIFSSIKNDTICSYSCSLTSDIFADFSAKYVKINELLFKK
jgi:hypothetical protein